MRRLLTFTLLLLFSSPFTCLAQNYSLLKDATGQENIRQILQHIYNAQHALAEKEMEALKQRIPPSHPAHPLLQAMNLYWQHAPLNSSSPYFKPFVQWLDKTNQQAEAWIEKEQDKSVSIFCTLTAHSLLTRFYSDKGDNMVALKEARATYAYMKEGFALKEEYNEFYFSTGIYNYYRVKYPETHPVYKPFMWFFEDGDKDLGLKYLEYAATNAIFTKVEAAAYLVHLYLHYENEPQKALPISRKLHKQYPNNRFIRMQLAESLLASGLYAEAGPHAEYLRTQPQALYKVAGELFSGLVQEKGNQQLQKAYSHYKTALALAQALGGADSFRSMAHAGMARYYDAQQQQAAARTHWQQALKLARYEYPVKPEAKKNLK